MTSPLVLGIGPKPLLVELTNGADFDAVLNCKDSSGAEQNWPVGTVWSLLFDYLDTVWTATTSGSTATFAVDKATADAIPNGTKVKLRYVNGTTDRVYYKGEVVRYA